MSPHPNQPDAPPAPAVVRPSTAGPRARSAGMTLVLILWIMVVLAVLAAGVAQTTKLDTAVRVAAGDRVRARWLARAGAYRAIEEVAADRGRTDSHADTWYDNEPAFGTQTLTGGTFTVCADRLGEDGSCAYGVIDEAAKLNIATANRAALLALPDMTDALADAIINWRIGSDQDDSARSAGPASLAAAAATPARRRIATTRSLALVDGISTDRLYGEDRNLNGILENNENDGDRLLPADNRDGVLDRGLLAYVTVYSYELNVDGSGEPRLNINTASQAELEDQLELTANCAKWIVENRGTFYDSISDLLDDNAVVTRSEPERAAPRLRTRAAAAPPERTPKSTKSVRPDVAVFRRIADRITATDESIHPGRININTAPMAVLQTLPGLNVEMARRIVDIRETLTEGFTSVAEVLQVPGMTVKTFKEFAHLVTVRSNVFTIRSFGQADRTGLRHSVEAVIARGPARPRVLYWKEDR